MSSFSSSKLTALGKACTQDVEKCPALREYYDVMTGNICIPLDEFLSKPHVKDEAFSLLGSKNLVTFDACWAMTRDLIGDENGELISGVIITSAVDLLV